MPDVGKYDARDRRAAETVEMGRRWRIADQIEGMERIHWTHAIWLFCKWSGYRKVTDLAWFSKHMAKGETVAEFRLRLWCDGCRRPGCITIIPAPTELNHLRLDMRKPEARALIVRDEY